MMMRLEDFCVKDTGQGVVGGKGAARGGVRWRRRDGKDILLEKGRRSDTK